MLRYMNRKSSRWLVYAAAASVALVPSSASMASTAGAGGSSTFVSTGLSNLGNTCYMNAQLQCAFHIPLVRKLALDTEPIPTPAMTTDSAVDAADVEIPVEGETSEDAEEKVTVESSTLKKESDAKIALRELFHDMAKAATSGQPVFPRNFCLRLGIPPMVQQDSQEFWKLLLPALEQESLSDLYKGCFESYITALDGSDRERRKEELFLDLSLDIAKR